MAGRIGPDASSAFAPFLTSAARVDANAAGRLVQAAGRDLRSLAGPGVFGRLRSTLGEWRSRVNTSGPQALAAETERGSSIASVSRDKDLARTPSEVRAESQSIKNADDRIGAAGNKAEELKDAAGRGWSKTDFLVGVAGVTLISLALDSFLASDGAILNINDIVILNNGIVRVDYDVAETPEDTLQSSFVLRPGDYVTFDVPSPTSPQLSGEQKVIQTDGDHTFYIRPNPPLQTAGGLGVTQESVIGSPAYGAPIGSTFWHRARVSSAFSSQFTGVITDTIQIAGGAAGTVITTTINTVTPTLVSAAATAANTVANLAAAVTPAGLSLVNTGANLAGGTIHALTPALRNTFCDIIPLACNSTLWWAVGGIFLFIICIAIIMKMKGR